MTSVQTELDFGIIELATEAFETFCEDIVCMFGIDIECAQLVKIPDKIFDQDNQNPWKNPTKPQFPQLRRHNQSAC